MKESFVERPEGNRPRYTIPPDEKKSWKSFIYSLIKKNAISSGETKADLNKRDDWQLILDYLYRKGIIITPEFIFEDTFADDPQFYSLRLLATSLERKTDGNIKLPSGGAYSRGFSTNLHEAKSKVLGEFLERYPLTLYKNENLLKASIKDLKREGYSFLNPLETGYFLPWQRKLFPHRNFDEKSIFQWVEGRSLMSQQSALIPAQFVFWNYRRVESEPFIGKSTTNGAGGMFTYEEAVLSGIYELIQRDAFLVYWLNKIPPPRLNLSKTKNVELKSLLINCAHSKIEVVAFDTTTDLGVPSCVVAILDNKNKEVSLCLGGGCGPDQENNVLRALTECFSVRLWSRLNKEIEYKPWSQNSEPFTEDLGAVRRVKMWANSSMRDHFNFFLKGKVVDLKPNTISFPSPKEELAYIVSNFSKFGHDYEIFVYSARHEVLEDLGYHSVMVSVPAIVPLYMDERNAPLGAKRIREVIAKLGCKPPEEPNKLPHPFP